MIFRRAMRFKSEFKELPAEIQKMRKLAVGHQVEGAIQMAVQEP